MQDATVQVIRNDGLRGVRITFDEQGTVISTMVLVRTKFGRMRPTRAKRPRIDHETARAMNDLAAALTREADNCMHPGTVHIVSVTRRVVVRADDLADK